MGRRWRAAAGPRRARPGGPRRALEKINLDITCIFVRIDHNSTAIDLFAYLSLAYILTELYRRPEPAVRRPAWASSPLAPPQGGLPWKPKWTHIVYRCR